MESSITADLISVFEEEQRKVVFSALSDYLHLGLFTDVSLTCGLQGPTFIKLCLLLKQAPKFS